MKPQILLKLFLLLALVFHFTPITFASEFTSTLTSSGITSTKNNTIENNIISSDGTAFGPSSSNLALGGGIDATSIVTPTVDATTQSNQVASALGAFGNLTFGTWFWILFILLLVILGSMIYTFRRSAHKKQRMYS